MKWASHRRPRRRCRRHADSAPQYRSRLQHGRSLRFESLESRRLLDASQLLINEVLVNPLGVDAGQEYIEIRATAGTAVTLPTGTYLLGIEGDTYAANPGDVQNIFDLSGFTTGSDGLLVLVQKGNSYAVAPAATKLVNTGSGDGWGNGSTSSLGHTADGVMVDIENTSLTLMLVFAPTAPTLSTDIDANNDGIPDGAEYSSWTVLDSIGLLDGQNDDLGYGAINFRRGGAGSSLGVVVEVDFNAGYVARKGSATGATTDDWVAGFVGGAANNWTLSQASDPGYVGHALSHIGNANPNTNPLLAHSNGVYAEGSSQAVSTADLQATDLEQSAAALRYTLNSLPVNGSLQKDGAPLAVGDKFTQADIDTGRISYSHDGGETTSDGFDFGVVDGAGGSASGTFAITITPVNDLPMLAANLGLTIDEDLLAPITTSLLQVVDVDNTAEQLTYTLATVPAHGTLAKNGVPLAANESFTQHDIDLGLITYQHNGDVALADQFTFTVADGGGGTIDLKTFAITITQFNLPPVIAVNEPTVAVVEGGTATTGGTFSDPDGDDVILTASVGAVVNNGDGTWSWSYTPSDGPEDSQTVTITIDDGLATAQATFVLDVANAAPIVAANSIEIAAVEGETATNTGTVADVAGDVVALTASVGTVTNNGDGTWSWSWNTSDGPEDSQVVTITADDGLLTSQTTFVLNVTNAAPAIAVNNVEVTVAEGEMATNSGTFADVPVDAVTLIASIGAVVDNGDGTWSWSFATADGPEDSQTVTITADDGIASAVATFMLTVTNSAPIGGAVMSVVTVEAGETATNAGTYADVAADIVTLSASIGTVTDHGDGTWSWSCDTTGLPEFAHTVTITADDGLATTEIVFTLEVIDTTPEIEAAASTVTVSEGAAATNSGTFEDFVAETLVLSASVGTVTDHGDGTWSWSYITVDGPADSQTVTITATDGVATAQTSFTLEVQNTAPSIAANYAEVAINEGEIATNSGTFADVAADTVTFSASIGAVTDHGDGTWSWSWTTANGPEDSQFVIITADDGLAQSQVTFTLTVANAAPSIAVNASEVAVSEGEMATNTGTFADVAADTVTLSASIGAVTDLGDGTWSWSWTTANGPEDSQIVTITADDGLASSQLTFALTVNNVAPTIAANNAEVVVSEGELATNSGTLTDVAADTVVLSASIGIVIDHGDGTWSWSYTSTSALLDTCPVTITATDSDNLLATVVFHLTVNLPESGGDGSTASDDPAESSSAGDGLAALDDAFAVLASELA